MPEFLGICLLVGYAVMSTKFVMDEHKEIKKQEQEEEEFQRRRIARRVQVIYRDKLTARAELMHEWEHVGVMGEYHHVR